MKIKSTYELPFKRRYKGITDYRSRLKILKSGKPRLVVRKTLKHIIAEIVEFDPKGDRVIAYATSQELKKFNWDFSTSNISSAYLVGLLIGKRGLKKGVKEAVLDIGLYSNSRGSKINAVLKGVLDAGIKVPHSPEILPDEHRIKGFHIVEYLKYVKNKNQFSQRKPDKLPEIFEKIRSNILKGV